MSEQGTYSEHFVIKNDSEPQANYNLTLFVSGATGNSLKAINNIKRICEQYLKGKYSLDIVDVYLHPEKIIQQQIIAIPTLLAKSPQHLKRLTGDMSETAKVLKALRLV